MRKRTLARHRLDLDGTGWAHPYPLDPFSPVLYADGGGAAGGDGGQGSAGTGQQGGDGGQQQGGDGTGGQDPAGQQQVQGAQQQTAAGDITSLPEWAQKEISDARKEAGKARTVAKQNAAQEARQQLAQDIGKALGLVTDDKPADPAQLTQQVTDLSGQLRAARVELAAYRAAGKEGANADRLLNSREFADKLAALDPSDEKFAEQLKQAITDEVATDPDLYRAAPAGPARGGAEFNGPPAGDKRPATLTDAIAAKLGG
ncbi:hypothetical protein [Streptomyces aquilus]|uniref:hypothetical protein n=1 Tax=Streptomyces aquilus TaxID=2548456 RepID=UPI0036C5B1B1